jgi:hypothetical protein
MSDSIKYERSDAWLLLSVIYAAQEHHASLGEIIMCGDYINHMNFTSEELDGGLARLKAGHWIAHTTEGFLITAKTGDAYQIIADRKLSAHEERKQLETTLGIKVAL